MPRLSARQYAQRIGVSASYVSRLVRGGKLPVDAHGRIDPEEADHILAAGREPARRVNRSPPSPAESQPPTAPPPRTAFPTAQMDLGLRDIQAGGSDLPTLLLKARTKTEVEKGKLLEFKARVATGKFIDADEVKVAAFNKARVVRDALLNIASRLAPLVAAEADERVCFELIDRDVRQALEDLAGTT